MAQPICALVDEATKAWLTGIVEDRARPLMHILRARIVLLAGEHFRVQEVTRHTLA